MIELKEKLFTDEITSSLYPTTKVVGLLEDGIPDSLCFTRISQEIPCRKSKAFPRITRLKSCVFNESKIKKLTAVLGRETAERLSKAYLIGDETTRKRIIVMLYIMKASVLADGELRDASLLEPPETKGNILLQCAAKHATDMMKISAALIEDLDKKGFTEFVF